MVACVPPAAGESHPPIADEELMRLYVAGDAAAFAVLYRRYERPIHALFTLGLRNRARADELTQQAFLNLHAARGRFRGAERFASWLHAIAYNLLTDEWRSCGSRRYVPWEGLDLSVDPFLEELTRRGEREERAARVRRALDELPPTQRVPVLLCKYQGLSCQEAARVVGTTPEAVKLRIFRALQTLRRRLGLAAATGGRGRGVTPQPRTRILPGGVP